MKPSMRAAKLMMAWWIFCLFINGLTLVLGIALVPLLAMATVAMSIGGMVMTWKQIDKDYEAIELWRKNRYAEWLEKSPLQLDPPVNWDEFETRLEGNLRGDPWRELHPGSIDSMIRACQLPEFQVGRAPPKKRGCQHESVERFMAEGHLNVVYLCADCGKDMTYESPFPDPEVVMLDAKRKILNPFRVPSHQLGEQSLADTEPDMTDGY